MAGYLPGYAIAAVLAAGGFEKVCSIDFRTLTPTSITSDGVTVIDGIDFTAGGLTVGLSWEIDAAGLYAAGGATLVNVDVDLDDILPGFDLSAEECVALVVESNDLDMDWGAFVGESLTSRVGFVRTTDALVQIQRRIGGTAFVSQSQAAGTTGQCVIWTSGGSVVGRFSAQAMTEDTSPLELELGGASAGAGGEGLTLFTVAGGFLRFVVDAAEGRTVRIRRATVWRLPVPGA